MGNYAETDVIASVLACDRCAYRLTRGFGIGHGEVMLTSRLPLVSFVKNEVAWTETVHIATQKRFHKSQLPLVFLGILYTKLERLVDEDRERFTDLREGIKWVSNTLMREVILQEAGDPRLSQFGTGALHEVLLRNFNDTLGNPSTMNLLEYPLDGFIVANAAISNSRHGNKISGGKRKIIVFLRFLYHLTERYHEYAKENDELVIEAAKALVLLADDPEGPKSLFRWELIRHLSTAFTNPVDMRKFLTRTSSYRYSLSIKDLRETPFLSAEELRDFERLGVLFNWISGQAAHATAVFLHHLFRTDRERNGKVLSPQEHFIDIRNAYDMQQALSDPADVSAKKSEELIRSLPPL